MGTTFKAACVQLNSGNDMQANIAQASAMVREAAAAGAQFIMTPEYTAMMDGSGRTMRETARDEAEHPALAAFRALAVETKAWLLVGSLTVTTGEERIANRSFLVSDAGAVVARYDKIHMFDVDLAGGDSYRESATVRSGADAVLAPTPWGLLGMTVCYDLRFAALYRALAQGGASIITVPSCFTAFTGKAHWHVLLRARAIETGCFVIAPAQVGKHEDGREIGRAHV